MVPARTYDHRAARRWLLNGMARHDWRNADLARASRVSESNIGRMLNGKRVSHIEPMTLAKLEAVIGPYPRASETRLVMPAPRKPDVWDRLARWSRELPRSKQRLILEIVRNMGFKERKGARA